MSEKVLFIGRSCSVDLSELFEREFRSVLSSYYCYYGDSGNVFDVFVLRRNFMLVFMSIVEQCDDVARNCEELLRCIEEAVDREKLTALTSGEVVLY